MSEALKRLKVKFRQFIDTGSGEVRMGFGTEDETVTLRYENALSFRRRRKGDNVEIMDLKGNTSETNRIQRNS